MRYLFEIILTLFYNFTMFSFFYDKTVEKKKLFFIQSKVAMYKCYSLSNLGQQATFLRVLEMHGSIQ